MRVGVLAAAFAALLTVGTAQAQQQASDQLPEQCQRTATGGINWQACLDASPPNAPWRMLAEANLGTEAFRQGDYATAVRHYDAARPPAGQQLISDMAFHTFRGSAYWHVGRRQDALADADLVYRMIHRDPSLPAQAQDYFPEGANPELAYVLMLPIWQTGDQERFRTALAEFRVLPADDWRSYANRSAVLTQINDLPDALSMSERALSLAPTEPPVLNNHCYILVQLDRASEALPFCERAVAGAPGAAPVRDSMADVYAALGRCAEAERELAEARRLDPSFPGYQEPLRCTAR